MMIPHEGGSVNQVSLIIGVMFLSGLVCGYKMVPSQSLANKEITPSTPSFAEMDQVNRQLASEYLASKSKDPKIQPQIPLVNEEETRAYLKTLPHHLVRHEAHVRERENERLSSEHFPPVFETSEQQDAFENYAREKMTANRLRHWKGEFEVSIQNKVYPAKVIFSFAAINAAHPTIICAEAILAVQGRNKKWVADRTSRCSSSSLGSRNGAIVLKFQISGEMADDVGHVIAVEVPYLSAGNQAWVVENLKSPPTVHRVNWTPVDNQITSDFMNTFEDSIGSGLTHVFWSENGDESN